MHDSATQNVIVPPKRKDGRSNSRGREIHKVLSAFGRMNGYRTESRVVEAWKPRWRNHRYFAQIFTRIRSTTKLEDTVLKYDVVFETTIPEFRTIGVQIKTSTNDYIEFGKKYPDIPIVLVSVFDDARMIRKKTLFAMLHKHPGLAPEMAKRGCTISPRTLGRLAEISKEECVLVI